LQRDIANTSERDDVAAATAAGWVGGGRISGMANQESCGPEKAEEFEAKGRGI